MLKHIQKLIPNTKKFITRDKNMPYRGRYLSIKQKINNYKPKFKIEKGIEKLIGYYKKFCN